MPERLTSSIIYFFDPDAVNIDTSHDGVNRVDFACRG